jgi:catechol 2,3-dioxygenase-like lactoylglutathione lyase family enzyme
VALPCADLDASLAWYLRYTPLRLLDRRADTDGSAAAWIGHPDNTDRPFILVLVHLGGPRHRTPRATLAPFAHLGIEMPDRRGVDDVAARAEADGCLHWGPTDHGAPIGYLCAARDPDGNVVEFSHGQGVYDKAAEVWGAPPPPTGG